jgi:hypothetical protein
MIKCIYDLTTGQVIATCNPDQNLEILISNWTNVGYIQVETINYTTRDFNFKVNLETLTLEKL